MSEQNSYFVKLRGRTLGPFEVTRLRQMVQQGQISRVNPISSDGQQWQKAGDLTELFQQVEAAPSAEPQTMERVGNAARREAAVWYYALNGEQKGPATLGVVQNLIRAGSLRASDLIWREGMSDWLPSSQVPDFSNYFATDSQSSPVPVEPRQALTRQERQRTSGGTLGLLMTLVALFLASCALAITWLKDPLGKGISAYDLSTPERAVRSMIEIDHAPDIRATQQLTDISNKFDLTTARQSLEISQIVEFNGKQLVFFSIVSDKRRVQRVWAFEKAYQQEVWIRVLLPLADIEEANKPLYEKIGEWISSDD